MPFLPLLDDSLTQWLSSSETEGSPNLFMGDGRVSHLAQLITQWPDQSCLLQHLDNSLSRSFLGFSSAANSFCHISIATCCGSLRVRAARRCSNCYNSRGSSKVSFATLHLLASLALFMFPDTPSLRLKMFTGWAKSEGYIVIPPVITCARPATASSCWTRR
jgi:hypothetical protein